MLYAMARKTANDDPLAPVTLAVGQEELLLDRAVREVVVAARAADADPEVRELASDEEVLAVYRERFGIVLDRVPVVGGGDGGS